ncbi:MAG: hypothetical protein IJZ26_01735, partial [Clostridia bacterium]|nr:hypothetical protein [Clostridia bacterium]
YKKLATYNSFLDYSIATGGFRKNVQKSKKVSEKGVLDAKHTMFVNPDGELKSLSEIPIAQVELKDGDINYETFKQCFTVARNKTHESLSLRRKRVDDKEYLYLIASADFCDLWLSNKINNETYRKYLQKALNDIRLDLDQIKNACNIVELLNADGSVLEELTLNNQAFIGKNNIRSYCLIGNPKFAKESLLYDYERLYNFGNAYSLEKLMFLPSEESIKTLINELQKYTENTDFKTMDQIIDEEVQILNLIAKHDPSAFLKSDLNVMDNSKPHQRLEWYVDLIDQRKKMNYRDPQQNNKLISMKNAWDLGYDNKKRVDMVQAFGEFGGMLYDRAYAIKFVNYFLETYKTSGSILDLTSMTGLFFDKKFEEAKIENAYLATPEEKAYARELLKEGSLNEFISTIQRFNKVLNVDIYKDVKDKKGKVVDEIRVGGFIPFVQDALNIKLKPVIKPWKLKENGTAVEKFYYNYESSKHILKKRKAVLKELLDINDSGTGEGEMIDENCLVPSSQQPTSNNGQPTA